jgi:hypothetical protein
MAEEGAECERGRKGLKGHRRAELYRAQPGIDSVLNRNRSGLGELETERSWRV